MGKDKDKDSKPTGLPWPRKERQDKAHTTDDPKHPGSFWVDSPERRERGVGDRQEGGRDD